MAYATIDQLLDYLHLTDTDVPTDIERLLSRASELLDYVTRNRLKASEVARDATCAQVEYWLTMDESTDILGNIKSFSIKSFSVDYGNKGIPSLAPRAKRILLRTGLLYKGVGVR